MVQDCFENGLMGQNMKNMFANFQRLDSNIESKSLNNTYLNIIKILNKLFKKLNIIKSQNLVVKSTLKKG